MNFNQNATARWQDVANGVLDGRPVDFSQALAMLTAPDAELLDLLAGAYRIRRHFFGHRVKLNYLINAKSGLCPEDCHYCSQSAISDAPVPKYRLMDKDAILHRVQAGVELKASTCCIVLSGRRPARRELQAVAEATREIKDRYPGLKVCACMGLLSNEDAAVLKEAGVDRYNHNINTAEEHYAEICSTHTYQDRVGTVQAVKEAGMSPCSGVIIGMGEELEDIVRMALSLRDLQVESIPVNFLLPIAGTPMAQAPGIGASRDPLTPGFALRVLSMFRMVCPDKEIRISAGREVHLRSLQPLALYAANALFVSDYLTEPGQAPSMDLAMIEDLGFEIDPLGTPMGPLFHNMASSPATS